MNLFSDTAGTLVGPPVQLHLKTNATSVFARALSIPFPLCDRYSQEIDKKLRSGFYVQVTHSEWALPTHNVTKGDKLRITGDFTNLLLILS